MMTNVNENESEWNEVDLQLEIEGNKDQRLSLFDSLRNFAIIDLFKCKRKLLWLFIYNIWNNI